MNGNAKIILVVEDEKSIRKLVTTILKRGGYQVLEAGGHNEAITIWSEQVEPIDLLLSDILLPGVSGPALALELVTKQPALKVVFTSGNPAQGGNEMSYFVGKARILQKPFAPSQLLEVVEAALR